MEKKCEKFVETLDEGHENIIEILEKENIIFRSRKIIFQYDFHLRNFFFGVVPDLFLSGISRQAAKKTPEKRETDEPTRKVEIKKKSSRPKNLTIPVN